MIIFFLFFVFIGFLAGVLTVILFRVWAKRIRHGEKHGFQTGTLEYPKADDEMLGRTRRDRSIDE